MVVLHASCARHASMRRAARKRRNFLAALLPSSEGNKVGSIGKMAATGKGNANEERDGDAHPYGRPPHAHPSFKQAQLPWQYASSAPSC